ncbi:MAG: hypothetical protein ACO1QR_00950 [Chthoniobacteraceae bacterium]
MDRQHRPVQESELQAEAARATEMLHGRVLRQIWRHRPGEIGLEFEDGTRLFVDSTSPLELSITGTQEEE